MICTVCSGCSAAIKPQSRNLSFCFNFESGDELFTVNAETNSSGELSFAFVKPETVNNLKVEFLGDTVKTTFSGLKSEFLTSSTDFGILSDLNNGFCALQGAEAVKNGELYTSTVLCDGKEYIFNLTELGVPIGIKFDNTVIEFENIVLK